ncbi:hypothetical protein K435DRAFT_206157 [Dendrothele bispora CBS 962.96]|uniref:Secreted protein n=1 Tax=Dendrothele bispora (strain CBS 962.96) TaxID=1314807 RepID=A0A4S8LT93_DENBC|nr:hypothetical protein K435DRAFT_206157 [Dendrothele bispora CBS 962.96]
MMKWLAGLLALCSLTRIPCCISILTYGTLVREALPIPVFLCNAPAPFKPFRLPAIYSPFRRANPPSAQHNPYSWLRTMVPNKTPSATSFGTNWDEVAGARIPPTSKKIAPLKDHLSLVLWFEITYKSMPDASHAKFKMQSITGEAPFTQAGLLPIDTSS